MSARARGFSSRQGDLDGLCGLYSIINAVGLMGLDRDDLRPIMDAMVHHLERKGELANTFVAGATRARMTRLLGVASVRTVIDHGKRLRWRWLTNRQVGSLDEMWRQMDEHQRKHGTGSIILGLAGKLDHWSCIYRVAPKTLLLADSGPAVKQKIARRHCAIAEVEKIPHIIEEAFLLRLEDA